MSEDNKMPKVSLAGMISTVKPTTLGQKKVDTSVAVTNIARKLFAVEAGQVKVPRKRQTSEVWPQWFEALEAPAILYFYFSPGVTQSEDNAIPVKYDEKTELFYAIDDEGNEKLDDNGRREEYTGDNVVEMASPDGREVESTMEGLQQLRNAITRFNTKTGKKLATRFVSAQRDQSGRTLRQKEVVYRLK